MIKLISSWLLYALFVVLISWVIPGIDVDNFYSALILSLIIGLLNVFVKPVLNILTLPINVLTLGLFGLVLNTFLFMLAGYFTNGVEIDGFIPALLGSILLAVAGQFISKI